MIYIKTKDLSLSEKEKAQRQEIFAVEDEIIEQRNAFTDSLQQRLQEETTTETLFTLRWRVA